jgi:hypothetical protein
MPENVYFRTKRTGCVNAVVVGSVTHKRILAEPENYEQVPEPKSEKKGRTEPEKSGP